MGKPVGLLVAPPVARQVQHPERPLVQEQQPVPQQGQHQALQLEPQVRQQVQQQRRAQRPVQPQLLAQQQEPQQQEPLQQEPLQQAPRVPQQQQQVLQLPPLRH